MENYTEQQGQYSGPQRPLPNATATLILGILSIPGCCCYAIPGLIMGIIAIVLGVKDGRRYRQAPAIYTVGSYNNVKAGKICGIIGIVLSVFYAMAIIFAIAYFGIDTLRNPQALQDAINNMK